MSDKTSEATVVRTQPVVEGAPSRAGSNEDAVLMLVAEIDEDERACSAALVAPNLVATALHCVAHGVLEPFGCTATGEVKGDGPGGYLGLHLPPETISLYARVDGELELIATAAEVVSTLSSTSCIDDLAFVVLDRDLDLPIFPMRLEGPAEVDEEVVLAGYGPHDPDNLSAPWMERTRNSKGDLKIWGIGLPQVTEDAVMPARTIIVQGPAGCQGDSGGPLYAKDSGALLGIYALLLGESCASEGLNLFPHLPDYAWLVRDAFDVAGAEPVLEPGPNAVGEACSEAADCEERLCETVGGPTKLCTRVCATPTDCPNQLECLDGLCAPARSDTSGTGGTGGMPSSAAGAAGDQGAGGGSVSSGGTGSNPDKPKRKQPGGCSLALGEESASSWLWGVLLLLGLGRRQRRPSSGSG